MSSIVTFNRPHATYLKGAETPTRFAAGDDSTATTDFDDSTLTHLRDHGIVSYEDEKPSKAPQAKEPKVDPSADPEKSDAKGEDEAPKEEEKPKNKGGRPPAKKPEPGLRDAGTQEKTSIKSLTTEPAERTSITSLHDKPAVTPPAPKFADSDAKLNQSLMDTDQIHHIGETSKGNSIP